MIKGNRKELKQYYGINPNLDKALGYLEKTDLELLTPDRYEIDGDNVYLKISEYDTKKPDELKAEAHRVYGDIQYVVSGVEEIGVAELKNAVLTGEFDTAKDIGFYDSEMDFIHLDPGEFVILFPEDVHKPKCSFDDPVRVRKALVKFLL